MGRAIDESPIARPDALLFGIILFDLACAVACTTLDGSLAIAGRAGIAIEIDASVAARRTID